MADFDGHAIEAAIDDFTDQSFTGECPTCTQPYLAGEIERLQEMLAKIHQLAAVWGVSEKNTRILDGYEVIRKLSSTAKRNASI